MMTGDCRRLGCRCGASLTSGYRGRHCQPGLPLHAVATKAISRTSPSLRPTPICCRCCAHKLLKQRWPRGWHIWSRARSRVTKCRASGRLTLSVKARWAAVEWPRFATIGGQRHEEDACSACQCVFLSAYCLPVAACQILVEIDRFWFWQHQGVCIMLSQGQRGSKFS